MGSIFGAFEVSNYPSKFLGANRYNLFQCSLCYKFQLYEPIYTIYNIFKND